MIINAKAISIARTNVPLSSARLPTSFQQALLIVWSEYQTRLGMGKRDMIKSVIGGPRSPVSRVLKPVLNLCCLLTFQHERIERRDSLSSLVTSSSDDMVREYSVQQPPQQPPPQQQQQQQHQPQRQQLYQQFLFPPPSFKMPGPPPIPPQSSTR